VTCNHRSWIDVVVLQKVFHRRIPFLKFFIKRELIWVPILGGAWWAMDFPFMKRHSREYLEAHPEKRGTDLETTRRACEKFGTSPVTVLNFPEGTRFTPEKHDSQESPYEHLLKPKAGGAAFVLEAMGERLRSLLDVTVVYPERPARFWDLFTGRLRRVVVRVQERAIPEEFLRGGSYLEDPTIRERFQLWVRQIWAEKDALIERILEEHAQHPGA
jgi:1-acyl-sn-glycerol-3-phosphate acyltransferase